MLDITILCISICSLVIYLLFNNKNYIINENNEVEHDLSGKLPPMVLPPGMNLEKAKYIPLVLQPNEILSIPTDPVESFKDRLISPELLRQCQGNSSNLWMGIYSQVDKAVIVFDVSSRPDFYATEGPYATLVGRDASHPLATMNMSEEGLAIQDLTDLSHDQRKTLLQWFTKLKSKYPIMGYLWPQQTGFSLSQPSMENDEDELEFIDQSEIYKSKSK